MIDARPSLEAAATLSVPALTAYLRGRGWAFAPLHVAGVAILSKSFPGIEEPIHIVLPEVAGIDDERRRIADALRTIEVVEELPLLTIVEQIQQAATSLVEKRPRGSEGRVGKKRRPQQENRLTSHAAAGAERIESIASANSENAAPWVSYPITHIDGVGPSEALELKRVGIRTTAKFLEAAKSPRERKELAARTGIDEKMLLMWANMVDRMRIKGIGNDYAELLRVAGVDTIRELKRRNASELMKAMRIANEKRKLVQLLPSQKSIGRWIEHAKKLPLKIVY